MEPLKTPQNLTCLVILFIAFLGASNLSAIENGSSHFVAVRSDVHKEPPTWALYQRQLIRSVDNAAVEFYNTYVDPHDHSLIFKDRFQSGYNSADDLYNSFRWFSLFTALGGSDEIDRLNRQVWEGMTRQLSRYGHVYREFTSNWDWMHHGEAYLGFYPMGMVEPHDEVFIDRNVRFAAMYTGNDPLAPNYDPELKQMRASFTGSRGPLMDWTKRGWSPTNANLALYGLPYPMELAPKPTTSIWINDHPENDLFAEHVEILSDRMAKGDVIMNLLSTVLVGSAYLYTGDSSYVEWVREYVGNWADLTERNNGITPDNVGISGIIGEHTGNWWGGYYGWVWPRGGLSDVMRPLVTAAKVTTLLTGDTSWAELPRSQMRMLREHGEVRDGLYYLPNRHDERGWHRYVREPAVHYVNLWLLTQADEDMLQIERLTEAEKRAFGEVRDGDLQWTEFIKGRNPGYAEAALRSDLGSVARAADLFLNERGNPETWFEHHWQGSAVGRYDASVSEPGRDPLNINSLVRLSVGAIPVHNWGEILHSQVRYFDGERGRSGLPPDVAAMVTRIENDWIEVEVMNLNVVESRQLVIQAGAYGEHRFNDVSFEHLAAVQPPRGRPGSGPQVADESSVAVNGIAFTVDMAPGSGSTLRIQIERYVNQPSYDYPWNR